MGTVRWIGSAAAVAQVTTISLTAYDATTTYKVTINGKVVSTLGTGGSTSTTAAALQALLAASTIPEFQEITWTVNSNVISGTAVVAGKPFTATGSVSGGTGTQSTATPTASSGANDWSIATNWDGGAVPVSTDDVYIENTATSIFYGLAQSGVTLNSLNIASSFTGKIGLPTINSPGGYFEYRPTYLAIGSTTTTIGYGAGAGSSQIKLDNGSVQTALKILNTASPAEDGVGSVCWKGTHASNTVTITKGNFSAATFAAETSTIATFLPGYTTSPGTDVTTYLGAGVTLSTSATVTGGQHTWNCTLPSTYTQTDGTVTVQGSGTGTTVNVYGGSLNWNSTGTITTIATQGCTVDFSENVGSCTITNSTFYGGTVYNDPAARVTFTNATAMKAPLSGSGNSITINRGPVFSMKLS